MNLKEFLFSDSPIAIFQGIALARIVVGLLMLYHGLEVFDHALMSEYMEWESFKGTGAVTLVYMGKSAEFLAGILLVLGLGTRIAAVLLICTLGYITFIIGNGRFWYEDQHPFLFVLFGILFLFTGPGSWSLDGVLSRSRKTAEGS
jgi:putative oxidoreductase